MEQQTPEQYLTQILLEANKSLKEEATKCKRAPNPKPLAHVYARRCPETGKYEILEVTKH